jgi:hypothetical protein
MENKQTAVEWLVDQMFKQGYFDGNKPFSFTNLDHLQHQAKEMEKQQHGQTWDKSLDNLKARGMNEMRAYCDFDDYYKEAYKKD